jgi:XTP/dITP diphosphohydrolase
LKDPRLAAFERLLNIMDDLREKCPWDKEQTMETLRHLTIEETYELGDAILDNNLDEVGKELGDLLLHIVFYAKIGSEKGAFDIVSVTNAICEKLIRRHPHIYSNTVATDTVTVKANWEKIKLSEGKKSVLEGVPRSLPSMVKAMRIQEKARGVGFDWANKEQVWEKVKEEIGEFEHELDKKETKKMEAEMGDLFFSLINYARFVDINPEEALERTNKKFIQRFQNIENQAMLMNRVISDLSLAEMESIWNNSK